MDTVTAAAPAKSDNAEVNPKQDNGFMYDRSCKDTDEHISAFVDVTPMSRSDRDSTMPTLRPRPMGAPQIALTGIILAFGFVFSGSAHADKMSATPQSRGIYRIPFADRTHIKVFSDFTTHRPPGRVDMLAVGGSGRYRVVAAAAGRVVAIEDRFSKQQVEGPGVVCHQNYVWIAHPNGEWTNYSHLAHGSVTKKAHLKIGDTVQAGQYLGDEGEVGCAMFKHVHFEVAIPDPKDPIDDDGFLKDNEHGKRERNPRFCGISGHAVIEGISYIAVPCRKTRSPQKVAQRG